MQLITRVSIRGLRSIQDQTMEQIGTLTTLVGRNSSGKSNVLRALNLFFNDEIEPGKPLNIQRDFHSRPSARRKKEVSVAVTFVLPANFNFRRSLARLKTSLGRQFSIEKIWGLNAQQAITQRTVLTVNGRVVKNGEDLARTFLALITFRYIPNRTVPAALLRDESRVIASSIFAKISGETGAQNLLTAVQSAADRLLKRAAESMDRTGAPLSSPGVSSPGSLAEMLSVSGFQAKGFHGNVVRDEEWGAGSQAFFLYEVLQAVDTNYSRSFGWKQAVVWGVEEPESGLHRDLETRLADELRSWSNAGELKLQIFQTTHSPIFTMAGDAGYWVDSKDGETSLTSTAIPNLVRDAERRGVTGWVQPVLAFPTNPVVLVEGPIDAEVLTHVAALLGMHRLRFLSLPQLDAAERSGGKDSITTYLKLHGGLIGNRPKENPLVVLLDWDVSNDELAKAQRAYGTDGPAAVSRMDVAHCAPEMGEDFRGIERFYPIAIVRQGMAANEFLAAEAPGRPISIAASQLSIAKQRLRARVLRARDAANVPALAAVVRAAANTVTTLSNR